MSHDPFEFIRNRRNSIPPNESDMVGFNLYMCNMASSMSRQPQIHDKLMQSNTIGFSRLTNRQQCISFTSLDGQYIDTTWHLPNKEFKQDSNEYIKKVMFVLECSRSEAQSMISGGKLDRQKIEVCYSTLMDQKSKRIKK